MKNSEEHGYFLMQTLVAGYPVAVYISNQTAETQENYVAAYLVQSYEERKAAFNDSIDFLKGTPYNQGVQRMTGF